MKKNRKSWIDKKSFDWIDIFWSNDWSDLVDYKLENFIAKITKRTKFFYATTKLNIKTMLWTSNFVMSGATVSKVAWIFFV